MIHVGRRMGECLELQAEGAHLALCAACQMIREGLRAERRPFLRERSRVLDMLEGEEGPFFGGEKT
jgi:hypothetical protein